MFALLSHNMNDMKLIKFPVRRQLSTNKQIKLNTAKENFQFGFAANFNNLDHHNCM